MTEVADKVRFTGYLKRTVPEHAESIEGHRVPSEDFILVTPGGGGDGAELVDWVLSAYEHDPGLPRHAVLLMGPFMPAEQRASFQERASRDSRLQAITFEARVEPFFERASAVVAMGGYNTFCEILSFGKPALIVPRTAPRREQYLRAERAESLGLVRMLPDDGIRAPGRMAEHLRSLPSWPRPRAERLPGLLDGLERIAELAAPSLDRRPEQVRLPRSA
jgi:predicted glycosyltransferase